MEEKSSSESLENLGYEIWKDIDGYDGVYQINGVHLIIEPKSVSAGVDIDELSEVLRSNTSFIYQKAYEAIKRSKNNDEH